MIYHFPISVREYSARGKNNLFPDIYECPIAKCHFTGRLRHHGFYTRYLLTLLSMYLIVVQRYYCPVCKHTVTLLPSFAIPRYQYSLSCLFFIFWQRSRGLSVQRIAELLNHSSSRIELASAHISFYLRRLRKNVSLIRGVLGSNGYVFDETKDATELMVWIIRTYRIEVFNLDHLRIHCRPFMAKP